MQDSQNKGDDDQNQQPDDTGTPPLPGNQSDLEDEGTEGEGAEKDDNSNESNREGQSPS